MIQCSTRPTAIFRDVAVPVKHDQVDATLGEVSKARTRRRLQHSPREPHSIGFNAPDSTLTELLITYDRGGDGRTPAEDGLTARSAIKPARYRLLPAGVCCRRPRCLWCSCCSMGGPLPWPRFHVSAVKRIGLSQAGLDSGCFHAIPLIWIRNEAT